MFNFFRTKSELQTLLETYNSLIAQAHELEHISREKCVEKYRESKLVLAKIQEIEQASRY